MADISRLNFWWRRGDNKQFGILYKGILIDIKVWFFGRMEYSIRLEKTRIKFRDIQEVRSFIDICTHHTNKEGNTIHKCNPSDGNIFP